MVDTLIPLSDLARAERDRAKALLATGQHPSDVRRSEREAVEATAHNSFRAVGDLLIDKMETEQLAAVTVAKARWLLAMAHDKLGDRPIAEITAREILDVLRPVEAAGKLETAKRLRAVISRLFRLAVAHDLAGTDPTFALRGALASPKPVHRAAIVDLADLRQLMQAVDGYAGQPTTRTALKLLALLVPRPGELRQARWDEFDLKDRVWSIPPERMKMRRPHRVPLSDAAVETLEALRTLTGGSDFLLPSLRSPGRPISENTLNAALRTLGYSSKEMTAHGFRAAFSTIANESGLWNADAIERQLAHIDANAVRRAYARGEYWDERCRMMTWWAGELFIG